MSSLLGCLGHCIMLDGLFGSLRHVCCVSWVIFWCLLRCLGQSVEFVLGYLDLSAMFVVFLGSFCYVSWVV